MKLNAKIGLLSLFLLLGTSANAQQTVVADLIHRSGEHQICIVPNLSHLTNADVKNDGTTGELLVNRLAAEEDGYAEFTIDHFDAATLDVFFSLINEDNPTESFSMRLYNGQVFLLDGGTQTLVDTYSDQDRFRIERCVDKIVYYKGNAKYAQENTVSASYRLSARVQVFNAVPVAGTAPRVTVDFPYKVTTQNFIALRKKLDGSYIQSNRQKLKFTYVEQYARDAGATINCRIYDWQRQLKHNVNLPNIYGVNWQVLVLPEDLIIDEYYVLEVGEANKGERYFLRFKY